MAAPPINYNVDLGEHLSEYSSSFDRKKPRHEAEAISVRRGGRYLNRSATLKLADPIQFQRERKRNELLPIWDEDGNKSKALGALRRQNPDESKMGVTEFMHQDLRRYDKVCGFHVEPRFEVSARPAGFIGLSNDDFFVRTVPYKEIVEATMSAGQKETAVVSNPSNLPVGSGHTTSSSSSSFSSSSSTAIQKARDSESLPRQVELTESSAGLDLAPVSSAGRERTVCFCRVLVAAGTTADAISEFIRTRVQSARHSSMVIAPRTGKDAEFVPCDIKFEPCSGYVVAPVGSSMQIVVRVRTWRAAVDEVLKHGLEKAGAWQTVKHGGRVKLVNVWSLEEYKREMHTYSGPSSSSSSQQQQQRETSASSLSSSPVIEYTALIRGAESSLASVLDQCRKVRDRGFINFTPLHSFGQPLHFGSLRFARAFLQGRYTDALLAHASLLARTSSSPCNAAIAQLRNRLRALTADDGDDGGEARGSGVGDASASATGVRGGNSSEERRKRKNLQFEWRTAAQTVEAAVDEERHMCSVAKARAEDVDLEPVQKLHELLRHVESVHGDCKAVLRDGIIVPRTVVQWHLRSLSDLHFNTLASIRVRRYGANRVVPGDLVFLGPSLDVQHLDYSPLSVPPIYNVPTCRAVVFDRQQESPAKWWRELETQAKWAVVDSGTGEDSGPESKAGAPSPSSFLHVVASEAEASRFDITQVVLPRWGWWDPQATAKMEKASEGDGQSSPATLFPTAPGIDQDAFDRVSEQLRVPAGGPFLKQQGHHQEQLFPPAQGYYRPLVVKPHWFHANCWDSRVGLELSLADAPPSSSSSSQKKDYFVRSKPQEKQPLVTEDDSEGLRRLVIPGLTKEALAGAAQGQMHLSKIRPSIRDNSAARAMLMATIPSGAASTVAAGGAITTAVRIALPATAAFASAMREVFRLDVVTTADVGSLVHKSVQESWRRQKTNLARMDRVERNRASKLAIEL